MVKQLTHAEALRRIDRLESLCSEMYQIAGQFSEYDIMPTAILDRLSAASAGQRLSRKSLLPYALPEWAGKALARAHRQARSSS